MTYSCHVAYDILLKKGGILYMIESRCGVLCSKCEYREAMNCSGCISMDKPFWGDSCPVKSCCEKKSQQYCGECDNFPCELLTQFAYDKEQGDNGERIKQCKQWMKGRS